MLDNLHATAMIRDAFTKHHPKGATAYDVYLKCSTHYSLKEVETVLEHLVEKKILNVNRLQEPCLYIPKD